MRARRHHRPRVLQRDQRLLVLGAGRDLRRDFAPLFDNDALAREPRSQQLPAAWRDSIMFGPYSWGLWPVALAACSTSSPAPPHDGGPGQNSSGSASGNQGGSGSASGVGNGNASGGGSGNGSASAASAGEGGSIGSTASAGSGASLLTD